MQFYLARVWGLGFRVLDSGTGDLYLGGRPGCTAPLEAGIERHSFARLRGVGDQPQQVAIVHNVEKVSVQHAVQEC